MRATPRARQGLDHARDPTAGSTPQATASPAQAPAQRAPGPERWVLVVDDDRTSSETLALLLEAHGYSSILAHDGLAAVELATRHHFDVVLLDIELPFQSGNEAARQIRQKLKGERLLLIALSGRAGETDKRVARDAGFDHYLVKPFELKLLLALLESRGVAAHTRGHAQVSGGDSSQEGS